MTTPVLPQNELDPRARQEALAEARKRYSFSFDTYPGLAMGGGVPDSEEADPQWTRFVTGIVQDVVRNDWRADKVLGGDEDARPARLTELKVALTSLLSGSFGASANDLVALLLAGPTAGEASSLADYRALFQTLPVPALAATFLDDAQFARKVVCGSNPEILTRATTIDPGFPLTEAHLAQVSPKDSLFAALAEGRLYYADYGMLEGLPPNTLGGPTRWVHPARVAYVVRPGTGTLSVFAIQVGRGPTDPVFTPADGWGWTLAKTHASVADTIAGAIWFHHARTHLVTEPLVVAAHRQLAPTHPVLLLLAPHFAGTMYINSVGSQTVFAEHGILEWFMGTPRDAIRALARRSVLTFDFDASYFPSRLAERGVDARSTLTDFPWRDDGLLVFDALSSWVDEYLRVYYASDADVAGDVELQAWLGEVTAADGGGLRGMGERGAIRTRAYLGKVLTQAIFSASALHSAMNFPVMDEMAFVPNSPFASYQDRPTRTDGWTEADWLAALPPLDQAQRQMDVAWLLGACRYGRLGDYPAFSDARVAPALARFRARLAEVEATIDSRNTQRVPYIHLKPSRISPSINI